MGAKSYKGLFDLATKEITGYRCCQLCWIYLGAKSSKGLFALATNFTKETKSSRGLFASPPTSPRRSPDIDVANFVGSIWVPSHPKDSSPSPPSPRRSENHDAAPTSPMQLNHVPPPIMVSPVKLEEIPIVPVTSPAPPALEIPQIKQEKIDQQVFNTLLETQKVGGDEPICVNVEPEQIIERTEKGLKVRWKGFGPEDDTEEPVESLKHLMYIKNSFRKKTEEKKRKTKDEFTKKEKSNRTRRRTDSY
eukprot:TRINITY_DN286_c0_g1_i1.p1 TRINITY_DN286_c0_g1~~TRINITY_DN286_c0_g1_i1.p1  ORF type:complete len:249 (-),score=44.87 TRINITY_DN286_c0_g1_i1:29-775(-)